jgi:Mg-chelatase subunit ChlI
VEIDELEGEHEAEAEEVHDVPELDDPHRARDIRLALAHEGADPHQACLPHS